MEVIRGDDARIMSFEQYLYEDVPPNKWSDQEFIIVACYMRELFMRSRWEAFKAWLRREP